MSQVSSDSILTVLGRNFASARITIVDNLPDLKALVGRRPDLVFLGMEFVYSDDSSSSKIWLSDYLEDHEIAYTGSRQAASELGRYKALAKQRVLDIGLKTSAYHVIKQMQLLKRSDLTFDFPMFIKPTKGGGGAGIDSDSVVNNIEQLIAKVLSISIDNQSDSLVEEYLPGREFSVAVLRDELSSRYSVMPLELIAPADENGARLLSGEIKSSNTEQTLEVSDPIVKAEVAELALNVFQALGARDFGRIDIRCDSNGTPHFLEANLIPSLISGYGSFPKACVMNLGLGYESMILSIVRLGLQRSAVVEVSGSASVTPVTLAPFGIAFDPV